MSGHGRSRGRAALPRLTSLDAFRGFTMLLMASEIARLPRALLQTYPGNGPAFFVADMLEHREWVGVTPWDLIQPSFMFMVGVALPFSVASRGGRGATPSARCSATRSWRSLLLIALGIFLRSQGRPQTYFTFEDVLTQIGLGYPFLFLLAWTRPRWQAVAAAAILIGYWAAFALYPLPPPGFDWTSVGVPVDWPHHLSGFAAHWDKNTNLAHAADVWFLNLFPRESPFLLQRRRLPDAELRAVAGDDDLRAAGRRAAARARRGCRRRRGGWRRGAPRGSLLGVVLHVLGVCPLVKRIWTPSWAVFSAGWATLFLAGVVRGDRPAGLDARGPSRSWSSA